MMSSLILIFNTFIFALLFITQRYNIFNVLKNNFDIDNLIYLKTLNQLFTKIYIIKIYLIEFFCLIRNAQNRFVCIEQIVIMILTTLFIKIYQKLLNNIFQLFIQYLSQIQSYINKFFFDIIKTFHVVYFSHYIKRLKKIFKFLNTIRIMNENEITMFEIDNYVDENDNKKILSKKHIFQLEILSTIFSMM